MPMQLDEDAGYEKQRQRRVDDQWMAEDLAKLAAKQLPPLEFNTIPPLKEEHHE